MALVVAGSNPVTRPCGPLVRIVFDAAHLRILLDFSPFDPLWIEKWYASVVELVDTPDLGSGAVRCGGSSPFARKARE